VLHSSGVLLVQVCVYSAEGLEKRTLFCDDDTTGIGSGGAVRMYRDRRQAGPAETEVDIRPRYRGAGPDVLQIEGQASLEEYLGRMRARTAVLGGRKEAPARCA
jgi:hypothetical protein